MAAPTFVERLNAVGIGNSLSTREGLVAELVASKEGSCTMIIGSPISRRDSRTARHGIPLFLMRTH